MSQLKVVQSPKMIYCDHNNKMMISLKKRQEFGREKNPLKSKQKEKFKSKFKKMFRKTKLD